VADFTVRSVPIGDTRELRRAVLRPHETLEQVAAREAPDTYVAAAFDGDALVAAGMIVPGNEHGEWRIRGMATDPAARGRGAGSAVLGALLEHAAQQGALRVWCNARTPARSLYERAGMRVVSEEFELPEIGPHVVMELVSGSRDR
jgi:ribosomal protein S18 acetylase RimI-like enzyme